MPALTAAYPLRMLNEVGLCESLPAWLHGHPPQWLPSYPFHPLFAPLLISQGVADRTRRSKGMAAATVGAHEACHLDFTQYHNGSMRNGYAVASAGIHLQCLVLIAVFCFCQRLVPGGGEEGERLLLLRRGA